MNFMKINKIYDSCKNKMRNINISLFRKLILRIFFLCLIFAFNFCEIPSVGNTIENSYCFPNPFNPLKKHTTIRSIYVNNSEVSKVKVDIAIEDVSGGAVWYFTREYDLDDTSEGAKNEIDVLWSGTNNEGDIVSQGIYKAKIKIQSVETVSGGLGGDTSSTSIKIIVE